MDDLLFEVIVTLLTLLLSVSLGLLTRWLRARFAADQLQTAADIAKLVVRAVEQIGERLGIHGEQKLAQALEFVRALAAAKGLRFTDDQWRLLLEAAVQEINENRLLPQSESTSAIGFTIPTLEETED